MGVRVVPDLFERPTIIVNVHDAEEIARPPFHVPSTSFLSGDYGKVLPALGSEHASWK